MGVRDHWIFIAFHLGTVTKMYNVASADWSSGTSIEERTRFTHSIVYDLLERIRVHLDAQNNWTSVNFTHVIRTNLVILSKMIPRFQQILRENSVFISLSLSTKTSPWTIPNFIRSYTFDIYIQGKRTKSDNFYSKEKKKTKRSTNRKFSRKLTQVHHPRRTNPSINLNLRFIVKIDDFCLSA